MMLVQSEALQSIARSQERIADSLERLVIAADCIGTALSLQALKAHPTRETLDELMLRHERIARDAK